MPATTMMSTTTVDLGDRSSELHRGPAEDDKPAIRPANAADEHYLLRAFTEALAPFYGGDHEAHARRLIRTHLAGGRYTRGLLSTRQLLFVLWSGTKRVGVLNLVFKRQSTCKISPLILFPHSHRDRGFGALLLRRAEDEARRAGARQLYCTVAEGNHSALDFFRQHGFVDCGHSDGQYKDGESEVLLRRALEPPVVEDGPASIISVIGVQDDDWLPVRDLLLRHVAAEVDGADARWLEALRAGVDCPYAPAPAWVFAAKDRLGQHRAAAIAYPKKGDSVKVMPVVADDREAFRALVVDLQSLLYDKGRKAYLHITPNAEQVVILQEAGWDCEAMLPGAYSAGVVTQQWACRIGKDAVLRRSLRIRKEYFDLIRSGRKTLEIRVGYRHIKSICPGDDITLVSGSEQFQCHVAGVRNYPSFAEMVRNENVDQALPGTPAGQALGLLRRIYPADKENLGVVVLELKLSDP